MMRAGWPAARLEGVPGTPLELAVLALTPHCCAAQNIGLLQWLALGAGGNIGRSGSTGYEAERKSATRMKRAREGEALWMFAICCQVGKWFSLVEQEVELKAVAYRVRVTGQGC